MIMPKMIEEIKDLYCAYNHNLQPYMIVFDPKLPQKQRILCAKCMEDLDSITKMITFKKAQQLIEDNQIRLLDILDNTLQPNIKKVEQLQNHLYSLKSYVNQEFDQLIQHIKEWINSYDQMRQQNRNYSFLQELDKLIKNENIQKINEQQFDNEIIKINKALSVKMNSKLEQFKNFNEYKQCNQILKNISNEVQETTLTDDESSKQICNSTQISTTFQSIENSQINQTQQIDYTQLSQIDQSELQQIEYYVYEDLQNFINLLYSLKAVKEYFKENPQHPMIIVSKNKVILQLNISNSIHTDLIYQYKNNLKLFLQREKQNAKKIINEFKLILGDEYQLHIDTFISNSLNDNISMKQLNIEKVDLSKTQNQNQTLTGFSQITDNRKIFSYWINSKTYNSKTFDSFIFKAISYKQITEIKLISNFPLSK